MVTCSHMTSYSLPLDQCMFGPLILQLLSPTHSHYSIIELVRGKREDCVTMRLVWLCVLSCGAAYICGWIRPWQSCHYLHSDSSQPLLLLQATPTSNSRIPARERLPVARAKSGQLYCHVISQEEGGDHRNIIHRQVKQWLL